MDEMGYSLSVADVLLDGETEPIMKLELPLQGHTAAKGWHTCYLNLGSNSKSSFASTINYLWSCRVTRCIKHEQELFSTQQSEPHK